MDQEPFKRSSDGSMVYTSATLSRLWPAGFSTVGAVTFESAAYVARYVMKKITGKAAADHYETVEPTTGEVLRRLPEYTTMSKKCGGPGKPGGIGAAWYSTFKSDVYPSDFIVSRGEKMKPPKYYDRLHELEDELGHQAIKDRREVEALLRQGDSTTARLKVRETCKLAQIKNLKRGLDETTGDGGI